MFCVCVCVCVSVLSAWELNETKWPIATKRGMNVMQQSLKFQIFYAFVMRVSGLENMARSLDIEITPKLVLCDFMPELKFSAKLSDNERPFLCHPRHAWERLAVRRYAAGDAGTELSFRGSATRYTAEYRYEAAS